MSRPQQSDSAALLQFLEGHFESGGATGPVAHGVRSVRDLWVLAKMAKEVQADSVSPVHAAERRGASENAENL